MSDPLHDALRDATLATLLGSVDVPQTSLAPDGSTTFYGTVTIPSAFEQRLRQKAANGDLDDLIGQAMALVSPAAIAAAIEGRLADLFLEGLKVNRYTYSDDQPNWLKQKAKDIAVEACKAALSADEELLDTLRSRIGAEVDRNRVGITVQLSDPEAA